MMHNLMRPDARGDIGVLHATMWEPTKAINGLVRALSFALDSSEKTKQKFEGLRRQHELRID